MNVQQYYRVPKMASAPAAIPFISTWRTTNTSTGSSASNQIKLPLVLSGVYNFTVNWGDGNEDLITVWDQAETTHTYGSSGDYVITITGTVSGWSFSSIGDRLKILDISQWGSLEFPSTTNSNSGVFRLCQNLQVSATDNPILPVDAAGFFRQCTALTGNSSFNNWDLSNTQTITEFFATCPNFNSNVNNWDVSLVSNFSGVFTGCSIFNQPLNSWDVSNGTIFSSMFNGANAFNQDISMWDTSSAINMAGMLRSTAFNQPLNSWDVSNVTAFGGVNNGMFFGAASFNQDISMWDTSSANTMQQMFRSATAFNQNIGGWDVSGLTGANCLEAFMFGKTNLNYSASNLDEIYNGWTNRSLATGITTTFGSIKYTSAATAARALLTRTNSTVSVTDVVNNGSGLIRITTGSAHGRTTGDKIFIGSVTGTTEANGGWIVTVIDATTVDLQSSTFTNTYVSGGTFRTGYGWTITDGGI